MRVNRATIERVAGIAGIVVPVLALVWYGAIKSHEIDELHERVEDLEAEIRAYDKAQAIDSTVNRQVEALAVDVNWLKFHHHDEIGGRGHVD